VQGKDLQSIVENASRRVILLGSAAVVVSVSRSTSLAQALQGIFEVSFMAGSRDDAGHFMGGTEMRVLAAHADKLYAGNGYWEDEAGPEGPQGAEILVLDGPGAMARRSRL
jgi:basic membrane lipoprotein Med (substrate-binding protein (PBP1-ABC) superfamily)